MSDDRYCIASFAFVRSIHNNLINMNKKYFIGTWEIEKLEFFVKRDFSYPKEIYKFMVGVIFNLDENGDITWFIDDELKPVELFNCKKYEIAYHGNNLVICFKGHSCEILEFLPDNEQPKDRVVLFADKLYKLYCIRRELNFERNLPYLTLLPALECGYFFDIIITASSSKQFKVHSSILNSHFSDIDWRSELHPFNNQPEDVLETILHYVYSERLPEKLKEETARQVISVSTPYKSLNKLVHKCEMFLKIMPVKLQCMDLVNDHHDIRLIVGKYLPKCNPAEILDRYPAKVCSAISSSLNDTAAVLSELLLICERSREHIGMSKIEKHEIVRYVMSNVAILVSQILEFVKLILDGLGSLKPSLDLQTAQRLLPDFHTETIVKSVLKMIILSEIDFRNVVREVFPSRSAETTSREEDKLAKIATNEAPSKESTNGHDSSSLDDVTDEKHKFARKTPSHKLRSVEQNLRGSIKELPTFLKTLEQISSVYKNKLPNTYAKLNFKLALSKYLNIMEYLLYQPMEKDSCFSNLCLDLLNNEKDTDMEFEVVGTNFEEVEDNKSRPDETCIIKAHRFIVSARCDWFRKALTSGMKEAIDRKIKVYDTTPFIFRVFLEYIYSGQIKQEYLTRDILVELLILGDRYEMDCLKVCCENLLLTSINENSVFYLFNMANQMNAQTLRTRCLDYMKENIDVENSEEFETLPIPLKNEISNYNYQDKQNRDMSRYYKQQIAGIILRHSTFLPV